MIKVRFIPSDGSEVREVEAAPGERLLTIAQLEDQPLEGTCEGQMACSTCHVIVDPADFDKLDPPTEEEEDLLDFAASVTRTSRLSCQIWLKDEWGSLTVRMPQTARNMQGR